MERTRRVLARAAGQHCIELVEFVNDLGTIIVRTMTQYNEPGKRQRVTAPFELGVMTELEARPVWERYVSQGFFEPGGSGVY